MSERFKEHAWNACVGATHREFESLSARHKTIYNLKSTDLYFIASNIDTKQKPLYKSCQLSFTFVIVRHITSIKFCSILEEILTIFFDLNSICLINSYRRPVHKLLPRFVFATVKILRQLRLLSFA